MKMKRMIASALAVALIATSTPTMTMAADKIPTTAVTTSATSITPGDTSVTTDTTKKSNGSVVVTDTYTDGSKVSATTTKKGAATVVADDKSGKTEVKSTYKSTENNKNTVAVSSVSTKAKTVTVQAKIKVGKKTYKVTTIASNAFKKATKATTIDLSNANITTIKKNAFKGAKKAKNIKLNGKALKIKNIDEKALAGVNKKSVTITLVCKTKSQYNKLVKALKASGGSKITYKFKKSK